MAEINSDRANIEFYIVCIIDLLGQGEQLTGWSKLPTNDTERAAFIQALKKTVGTVEFFVQSFTDYFGEFDESQQRRELTEEQRQQYARFRECELTTLQFSDTFVFYCPLKNRHDDLGVEPLFRILTSCCMSVLFGLAGKCPVRGALCIGLATTLKSGNFYGPTLAQAHHLEAKVAGYPRIVASNELVEFLGQSGGFSSEATLDQLMRGLAQECKSLLYRDADGCWMVDFLGDKFREMQAGIPVDMADVVKKAYEFAIGEASRFEKHETLGPRYRKLLDYFELHIGKWGIPSARPRST